MSGGFRADLAALDGLVVRLARFDSRVDAALAGIDDAVARLCWDGAASQAYRGAHRGWVRDAQAMRIAAGELRRLVATAHENYSSAVAANARMWG